jgi:hypothetical protein
MWEGPAGDDAGVLLDGALPQDPFPDYQLPGELVMRDGMLVRLVPDHAVPEVPSDLMFGEALVGGAVFGTAPVTLPDTSAGLDRPPESGQPPGGLPDGVPVALWPVDLVRQALSGPPGAELARVVAEAARPDAELLSDLPDDVLGDLVTACGRLQSWTAGVQARAVAERAARETSPLAHSSLVGQVTSELVVTGAEAAEVVVRAESGAQYPTVISALETGRIDARKAHTLLRSASQLTVAERAEAIARFLPHAPGRTWKWLQSRMLAFAKSRHGATEAARASAQHRCVQLDRAENDMGWLSAYLPAADAAAVWGIVDDMARQLQRTPDEGRDLGQLRADCLTGIVTGRLLPADRFTDPGATSDTSTGADDHPTTGQVCTCGGRAPVIKETVQLVRVTPTRPVVRVTVPASALLGLDDSPGDLDGFGPITADLAAQLATDATWQRLLTDPATGILTDYSTMTLGSGRPGQTRADNLQPLCRKHHLLKTHAGWGVVRDPETGVTTWTTPTGRTHTRPPTVLDTHIEIGQVDPDTSYDLTHRALTGRRLPRGYRPTEPGAVPSDPNRPVDPDRPPF